MPNGSLINYLLKTLNHYGTANLRLVSLIIHKNRKLGKDFEVTSLEVLSKICTFHIYHLKKKQSRCHLAKVKNILLVCLNASRAKIVFIFLFSVLVTNATTFIFFFFCLNDFLLECLIERK